MVIMGSTLGDEIDVMLALGRGPTSDIAHEHIVELGQFIEARFAQEASDRVIRGSLSRDNWPCSSALVYIDRNL